VLGKKFKWDNQGAGNSTAEVIGSLFGVWILKDDQNLEEGGLHRYRVYTY
jgi:hypothetical protein